MTFTGFKQKDEAIKQFRKALEIQADIKLDKILATPEVQEVYDEAVAQQKEAAATPKKPDRSRARASTTSRSRSHGRASPIPIKANVDPSLGAKKVVLSFSADGADDFAEREMKEDPAVSGGYTAEIPASATRAAWSTTSSRRWATATRRLRRRAPRTRRSRSRC